VGREHTFEEDTCDPAVILSALCYLVEKVAAELRELSARARTVTLKLRYSDFKTITRSLTVSDPTNDEREIFRIGRTLFEKSYTRRVRIRLVGISTSNLYTEGWQPDLLDGERLFRLARLHSSIDRVRRRHGFHSILRASSFHYVSSRASP
jgi:DNA polymerase-4